MASVEHQFGGCSSLFSLLRPCANQWGSSDTLYTGMNADKPKHSGFSGLPAVPALRGSPRQYKIGGKYRSQMHHSRQESMFTLKGYSLDLCLMVWG